MKRILVLAAMLSGCGSAEPILEPPDYEKDARARLEEARSADRGGDLQRALALYASAITIDPLLSDAHLGRARIFEKIDRLGEAERAYAMAVETAPDTTRGMYHRDRGNFYHRQKRYESAVRDFDRCIDVLHAAGSASRNLDVHLERALSSLELLRWESAIADAKWVLGQNPTSDQKSRADLLLIDADRRKREFRR